MDIGQSHIESFQVLRGNIYRFPAFFGRWKCKVAGSSSSVPLLPPNLALQSNSEYTLQPLFGASGLRHIFSSVKIIAVGVILLLRMDFVFTAVSFKLAIMLPVLRIGKNVAYSRIVRCNARLATKLKNAGVYPESWSLIVLLS